MKSYAAKFLCAIVLGLSGLWGFGAERIVTWCLTDNWADELEVELLGDSAGGERFLAIRGSGFGSRLGLGEVGDPALPFKSFAVDVKRGGVIGDVSVEAEWEVMEMRDRQGLLPFPVVEPVRIGDPIVIPELSSAYRTVYPTNNVDVGSRQIYRDQESFTIRVTPFRWDGTTRTLYRAKRMSVKVVVAGEADGEGLGTNREWPRLTTSSEEERAANFIVIAPHKFHDLWCAYAEFRRHSRGGQGLTFKVKDLNEIYAEFKPEDHINGYTKKPDYELCIHLWLEKMYAQKQAKAGGEGEEPILQYVLLGGTPAKYQFDPEEHIPSRRFSAVATNGYLSDAYYGCMDRFDKNGNPTTDGEVWDYECDGVYMAELQPAGWIKCSNAVTKSVDWNPDVSVFRFPLMSAVKDGTGSGVYQTATEIMDAFTNRIAWAEGDAFPETARNVYANTGGKMHKQYARGNTSSDVNGEHEFFEGRLNVFDPDHPAPFMDSEIYSRHHVPDMYSVYRGWKADSTIHTCNYNPNTYAEIYSKSGEIVNNLAHGWARGADPMSAPQAYSATGFYRAYIIGNSCDCGMFDYCPSGSYGITNCICMGEAPILNPDPHCGALVSYTNARFGYGDNFTWGGSDCMDHFLNAGWAGTDENGNAIGELNGGQAHLFACRKFQQYGNPKCTEVNGVCEMEIVCHGDPLIKLTPQTNAVDSTDFSCARDFCVDATSSEAITFARDSTSAGFYVNGNGVLRLQPAPSSSSSSSSAARYRATREAVFTNVTELVWSVGGGAGRKGITFVGQKGDLMLVGNAKRYFGQSFRNVGEIRVPGGNVTLDFPQSGSVADRADFTRMSFIAPALSETNDFNVLRTRQAGYFPAGQDLVVISNCLDLQTHNIGAPIYATNAVIRVSPNPNWSGETFSQKVELVDTELISNSDKFHLAGTLDVVGNVKLSGLNAVRLTGANTVVLHDATLVVTAPIKDGATAGSLTITGPGMVRFATATAHTLGTTIANGAMLEVAAGDKMPGNTTVTSGGKLRPLSLPMSGGETIVVESGATLTLPEGSGKNGIYQLVNPLTTSVTVDSNATVIDEATGKVLTGTIKNGCFLSDAESIAWNGAHGSAWDFTHADWKGGSGQSVKYQDGYPLTFKDIGTKDDVAVTLCANVIPGFMDFQNTKPYRFEAREPHSIDVGSLVTSSDVSFGSNVTVRSETLIAATRGGLEFGNVETPELQMASGTSLRVTGLASAPVRKVKKLRFTFTQAYNSSERVAVAELHLFVGGTMMTIPEGTIIRDVAGQEIEVGRPSGGGYSYTWRKGQGLYSDNESLKALVDGKLDGNNKWWLGNRSPPVWFEMEFPVARTDISDYRFHMADYGSRNPKVWSISSTTESMSEDYKTIRTVSYADGDRQHWYPVMPLLDAGGFVKVMAGAKLYASGAFAADLDLSADGAVLAVTNTESLAKSGPLMTLALPETGKVVVDVSESAKHTEWMPLLVGFNLTEADFLKFDCSDTTAALRLVNGDVYIVTDGVAQGPFKLFMSGGKYTWSSATWIDETGSFDSWAALNARSDGEAQLHVTGNATLVADVGGSFGTIRVLGNEGASLTIVTNGASGVMTPVTFDASEFSGKLNVMMPLSNARIIAGSDVTLDFGEIGGSLVVGENARVSLACGTTITPSRLTMEESAELRQLGSLESVSLADFPKGIYSFENATILDGLMNDRVTIKVSDGERVVIYGRSENDLGKNAFNYILNGGDVIFQPNCPFTEWRGNLVQTGGTFSFVAQGNGGSLNLKGGSISVSGGTFAAANSVLNLHGWTDFSISGEALFQAGGISAQGASGSVSIRGATLEIGSGGMDALTVQSFTMNGGRLIATSADTTFKQAISAYGDITIAAKDGANMLMNTVSDDDGIVTFGAEGLGYAGMIQFRASAAVPSRYRLRSGTLNFVSMKFSGTDCVLVEPPPQGATILCSVTDADIKSTTGKNVVYCGSWITSKGEDEIKGFVKISSYLGMLADGGWILGTGGGYISFKSLLIKDRTNGAFNGQSDYWTAYDWSNNAGLDLTKPGAWASALVRDAYVTFTQGGAATMTLDTDVVVGLMSISFGTVGQVTIDAGDHQFDVGGNLSLDDYGTYANARAITISGSRVTVGELTLNKMNNVTFGGTVLGNVSVPSGGTYKQTSGTFGSVTLPPTAKTVWGMAIGKDELSIAGIEYTNGTGENVVLTVKGLELDDPGASFAKATVKVVDDLTYARWLALAESMRIASSKFTFDDDVTLDVGTTRAATGLPTNCRLGFQLTAEEEKSLLSGAILFETGGRTYDVANIKVVGSDGNPVPDAAVRIEGGKVIFGKAFDGTAYLTASENLNWMSAPWKARDGSLLSRSDWTKVKNIEVAANAVEISLNETLAIPGYMKAMVSGGNIMKYNLNSDLSVGSLDTGSDGYRRIIFTRKDGALFVTNGFVNVASLGGRLSLNVNGKVWARGVRDTQPTIAGNNDVNVSGTLMLGRDGLILSSRTPLYFSSGTIGAYEDASLSVANGIVISETGRFAAETNATLTILSGISGYLGEAIALTTGGEGTTVISSANAFSGSMTVESGFLKIGNAGSLGTGVVVVSGGELDVGEFRISNAVTLSGGKVHVVLTDAEAQSAGLIELFGYTGGAGGLKAGVEVFDRAGARVRGYFKVVSGKACFGVGEEPEDGILKIAAGQTVVLSSQGDYTNIKGGGTLVAQGFWPSFPNLADANCWTGMVKIVGSPSEMKYYSFASLGNASSTIEIAGSVYGYLAVNGRCGAELRVTGTLHINNGNSGSSYEFAGPLSGDGLIRTSGSPTTRIYFTGDTSAFAGAVDVTGGHCLLFAGNTSTASSAGKIVVADKAVAIAAGKVWSAVNGIEVKDGATVMCDLGELTGEELAKRAVSGVPYALTYFVGNVSNSGTIVAKGGVPRLPHGYAFSVGTTGGVSLVTTAPANARFGAISLNLHNGAALSGAGNHGLYPEALAGWANLKVANNATITVGGAKFTLSSSVAGWGLNNNPPDMIYKQYMDDSNQGQTRTVTITGVPYDQYRLIVYYSTDTANYNFRPLNVNGDWYAGALASQNMSNPTVKGRNEVWGHSGSNHNANAPAEGVNALITDVYSGDVTLSFTRNGGTGARATPCAIQVFRVGRVASMPMMFLIR